MEAGMGDCKWVPLPTRLFFLEDCIRTDPYTVKAQSPAGRSKIPATCSNS